MDLKTPAWVHAKRTSTPFAFPVKRESAQKFLFICQALLISSRSFWSLQSVPTCWHRHVLTQAVLCPHSSPSAAPQPDEWTELRPKQVWIGWSRRSKLNWNENKLGAFETHLVAVEPFFSLLVRRGNWDWVRVRVRSGEVRKCWSSSSQSYHVIISPFKVSSASF